MNLGDILTPFEIDTVLDLWRDKKSLMLFHDDVLTKVCEPVCKRRTDLLPKYLAYLLEYTLSNAEKYGVENWDIGRTQVTTNGTDGPENPVLSRKRKTARKMQSKLP